MEVLKPCPHCKESQLRISEVWTSRKSETVSEFAVDCMSCGASGGYYDTEEQAIEAWNRRIEK